MNEHFDKNTVHDPDPDEIDLIDLIHKGARFKYLFAILLITGIVAGYFFEARTYKKIYPAHSVVLLDKPVRGQQGNAWQVREFTRNIVRNSYKSVIHSHETLKTILESTLPGEDGSDAGTVSQLIFPHADIDQIASMKKLIDLKFEEKTCILQITASTRSPRASAYIVSELINQLNLFYNKQLNLASKKEAEHLRSILEEASRELEEAKADLLDLYQTNVLLTDPEFKQNNEIPARLKYEEDRLKQIVNQKSETYVSISAKYNELRFSDTDDVSQVTVIEPPTIPMHPIPPRYMKALALGGFLGLALAFMIAIFSVISLHYKERYGKRKHNTLVSSDGKKFSATYFPETPATSEVTYEQQEEFPPDQPRNRIS